MDTPSTNPQKKAPPLESLTKEELLTKYTGLRTLALKAKSAHNECQEDNKRLTEKIQQMEAQKTADKDCLKAMQEIVDSLTQFKLEATTQLQESKQVNTKLLDTINDMRMNQSDTEELAIENEALKRQVKRLTDENEELFADLQGAAEQKTTEGSNETGVEDLNRQIAELQAQITQLDTDRKAADEQNSALREKSTNFDKQFKELLAKSESSTKKLNLYKTKLIEISNKLKALKTTKKVLLEVVKDYAQTIPKWQKEILNASNKVFEKLSTYEKENRRLRAEIEELRGLGAENDKKEEAVASKSDDSDLHVRISELEQAIAVHEAAKQALTAELETLQATLAEKSTSLVQFKDENKELLDELKEINQVLKERGEVISLQMAKIQQLEKVNVERSQQLVKDKDAAISQLTQELQTLREKVHTTSMADTQSEVLSTSTISKADESARMREIEDSFEEKYFKLKSLAVRLKKKNTEQAAQLLKLEGAQKKEAGEEKATVEASAKDVPDNAASEYHAQVMMLKKEKEAFNLAKKELESEIQRLKATIKSKDQELQDGVEAQKALRVELEKLKVTAKKSNVLSLEMDAYEKSLNDINAKMKAKKIHCEELEGTIDAQTRSIDALKDQIKILEESLEAEKQHSKDQKQQLDLQQSKLRESEHGKAELAHQLEQETTSKERLQLALDDARLEVSKAVAEREKLCGSLETERNQLAKQVLVLESDGDAVRRQLKDKEQECDEAKTEFASYKIRAQSVLRNQSRDSGREQELDEELTVLRQNLEKSNGKLTALEGSLETATKSCEELQADKQRLQARADQLMELIEEARVQCETLMDENRRQVREHQEALKTQRLQYETLNTCYKQQIKDLEEKHVKELENLSRRLSMQAAAVDHSHVQPTATSDEHKINLILMQREEGEGSESSQQAPVYTSSAPPRKVSTSSRGNKRELMPLDELLNSSHLDDTTSYVDSEYERPVSPTIELQRTQTQLVQQESRVKHLTSLLAEAEQDLAKLTQLNELLKEEVRRQERSIERSAGLEQHIHNSEYLKNVIFKFLTLNSCDEKIHLVPVLNTILKLSPDETQKLQSVAKGEPGGALGWVTGKIWSNN